MQTIRRYEETKGCPRRGEDIHAVGIARGASATQFSAAQQRLPQHAPKPLNPTPF